MGRIITAGSLVAGVLLLTSCGLAGAFEQVKQDFHYSYDMAPGGHLELNNVNGDVEITGWDRNSIDVAGTKYANDQSSLDRMQVKVDVQGDLAKVMTQIPQMSWHGSSGVHYRIHVPRRVKLDKVETTNGPIRAENLEGGGRISSTNGKLVMTRLTGDYNASTTNGSIELEECRGAERAETTNGAVKGHLRSGSIEAQSTNGGIDVTVDQPDDRKPIRLSTTNGSVMLALVEYHGNPIKAETTMGSVNLRLPQGTNAHLDAETSMASISNDFPLSSTEESSKHELRGRIGVGGAAISASSSMGSIHIQRY